MPFMGQPDYRIHELNRRLQQRTGVTIILFNTYSRVILVLIMFEYDL